MVKEDLENSDSLSMCPNVDKVSAVGYLKVHKPK